LEKNAQITIAIVNYKTLDLTRLCLRSIRRYTDIPYNVIVVDNNSQDASTEYLRSLDWITLIEHKEEKSNYRNGAYAHGRGIDLALAYCNTPYFMSLHSDALVHRNGWLGELMSYFDTVGSPVCVGGGKIELASFWRIWIKKATDLRTFWRKLFGPADIMGKYRYYNRTICSIYRTEVLKSENLSFSMGLDTGLSVGAKLYFELLDRGYSTVELPDTIMRRYVWHLAHATQILNPDEFKNRTHTKKKTHRLLKKILNCESVRQIAADDSLDQDFDDKIRACVRKRD